MPAHLSAYATTAFPPSWRDSDHPEFVQGHGWLLDENGDRLTDESDDRLT